jgi:hypothetical protein
MIGLKYGIFRQKKTIKPFLKQVWYLGKDIDKLFQNDGFNLIARDLEWSNSSKREMFYTVTQY